MPDLYSSPYTSLPVKIISGVPKWNEGYRFKLERKWRRKGYRVNFC